MTGEGRESLLQCKESHSACCQSLLLLLGYCCHAPTAVAMKSVLLFFALTLTVLSAASAASASLNQVWWTKYNGKKDQVGCRNMCCSGRDSKCYSSGPRMGGRTSSNGKCFCDEGCLDMKDCCQDYSLVCQGESAVALPSLWWLWQADRQQAVVLGSTESKCLPITIGQ